MPDLTIEETKKLADNICPDCGGTKILEGPSGGGSINLLCDKCKMRFNFHGEGIPAQRLGEYKEDPPSIPVKIPGEGSIIQGKGRTNVSCIALHNCCRYGKPKRHAGIVELIQVGFDEENPTKYLTCGCGMRIQVPASLQTWDDVVRWFDNSR